MGDARIKCCRNGSRMENGTLGFSQRVSSQDIPHRLSDYFDTAMTCAWILRRLPLIRSARRSRLWRHRNLNVRMTAAHQGLDSATVLINF
jgi:hypothetical protein